MVATIEQPTKRLTMQVQDLAAQTTAIRSQDWDRDRFDIEFGLQNGTTYNSFVIKGEKIALVDSSHEKFRQLYLDALRGVVDPRQIDYLVISHTEPDHSGLTRDLLQLNPNITVVGSKVGIQFIADFVHQDFQRLIVKNGDRLELGRGHTLEFVIAPNLHWPDTMFSFDHGTGILYTCDAFGMHYCSERLFDESLAEIAEDFRFYYDCLMGPNARSVLSALKRMRELPPVQMIATGHGPILRYHVAELVNSYDQWSQAKAKAETMAVVFYTADYGYSDRISQAIARGIAKTEVQVEMMDIKSADPQEITELVKKAAGIVVGMPSVSGRSANPAAIGTILAAVGDKHTVGLFETFGGDDEPIDPLMVKFRDLGAKVAFAPIRVKNIPNEATYQLCEEAGTDLGQLLTRDRAIKQMKSLDTELDKALGRISGGLYIITAQKGDAKGAMVASWVSQASFQPLGVTIAVAKDRAIESLMHVGDSFVLNVLEEGNQMALMKHFLKRFPPGADRFAGVKTQTAQNGSPILADALAYMECHVVNRLELSDHWLVYSVVDDGRTAKADGLTAVHHRKVGNHY
jgi:flavorubredoxin/flavin reductase (DIM6/NTAB) family NADH-FMN oxidoreductase RutF